jgi:hypothetical protein
MQLKVVSLKPQSPAVCRARFTMIVVIPIFKLQSYYITRNMRTFLVDNAYQNFTIIQIILQVLLHFSRK